MGRKSRYSEYARGMSKRTVAQNATTTKSKSIKNKLQELKEKSQMILIRAPLIPKQQGKPEKRKWIRWHRNLRPV